MPARIHASSPSSLQAAILSKIMGKPYFENVKSCLKECESSMVPPRCTAAFMQQMISVVQQELSCLQFSDVIVVISCIQHIAKFEDNVQGLPFLMRNGLVEMIEFVFEEVVKHISPARQNYQAASSANKLLDTLLETLNDIANYFKDYKHAVAEKFVEPLMILVVNTTKNFCSRMEALRSLNLLLEGCDTDFLHSVQKHNMEQMLSHFASLLQSAGDFEMQVACTETLARLIKKSERSHYSRIFFSDENVASEFLRIRDANFESDCRCFLNLLNNRDAAKQSVFSLPCVAAYLGHQKLHPPKDEDLTEFWVDFNSVSHSVTLYVQGEGEENETAGMWETVIFSQDVLENYLIQNCGGTKQLHMKLKVPVSDLLPGCGDFSDSAHIIFLSSLNLASPSARSLGSKLNSTTNQVHVSRKSSQSKFNISVSKFCEEMADVPVIQTRNFPTTEALAPAMNHQPNVHTQCAGQELTPSRSKISVPLELMKTPAGHMKTPAQQKTPNLKNQQVFHQKTPSNQHPPKRVKTPLNIKIPGKTQTAKIHENDYRNTCTKTPQKVSVSAHVSGASDQEDCQDSDIRKQIAPNEQTHKQTDEQKIKSNKKSSKKKGEDLRENASRVQPDGCSLNDIKKKDQFKPPSSNKEVEDESEKISSDLVDAPVSDDIIQETQFCDSQNSEISLQEFQNAQEVEEEMSETFQLGSTGAVSQKGQLKNKKLSTQGKRRSPRLAALQYLNALVPKVSKKKESGRFKLYSESNETLHNEVIDVREGRRCKVTDETDDVVSSSYPSQDSIADFVTESFPSQRVSQRYLKSMSPLLSDIPEASTEASSTWDSQPEKSKGYSKRHVGKTKKAAGKQKQTSRTKAEKTSANKTKKPGHCGRKRPERKTKKPIEVPANKMTNRSSDHLSLSLPVYLMQQDEDADGDPYEFTDYSERETTQGKRGKRRSKSERNQSKSVEKVKGSNKKQLCSNVTKRLEELGKTSGSKDTFDLSKSIEYWKGDFFGDKKKVKMTKQEEFLKKKSFLAFPAKALTSVNKVAVDNGRGNLSKNVFGGDSNEKMERKQRVNMTARKDVNGETSFEIDDNDGDFPGSDTEGESKLKKAHRGKDVSSDNDKTSLLEIMRIKSFERQQRAKKDEVIGPDGDALLNNHLQDIKNVTAESLQTSKNQQSKVTSERKSRRGQGAKDKNSTKISAVTASAECDDELPDIEVVRDFQRKFDDLGDFKDDEVEGFVASVLKSLPQRKTPIVSKKSVRDLKAKKCKIIDGTDIQSDTDKSSALELEKFMSPRPLSTYKRQHSEMDLTMEETVSENEQGLGTDVDFDVINKELKELSIRLQNIGKEKQERRRRSSGSKEQSKKNGVKTMPQKEHFGPEIEDEDTDELLGTEGFNVDETETVVTVESFASVCQDILQKSGEGIAKTRSRRNIPAVSYKDIDKSYSDSDHYSIDEENEYILSSVFSENSRKSDFSDNQSELSWLAQKKKQRVTTYSKSHCREWTDVNPQMEKNVFNTTKKKPKKNQSKDIKRKEPTAPVKKKRTSVDVIDKEDEERQLLYFNLNSLEKHSDEQEFILHQMIVSQESEKVTSTPGFADDSADEDGIEMPRNMPFIEPLTPAFTIESIPSQTSLRTHSSGTKTLKLQVSFDDEPPLEVPDVESHDEDFLKSGPSKLSRPHHSSLKRKYESILADLEGEDEEDNDSFQTKKQMLPRKLFEEYIADKESNESSMEASQSVDDDHTSTSTPASWEYQPAAFPMTDLFTILGQNLKKKMMMKEANTQTMTETAIKSAQQHMSNLWTKQSKASHKATQEFRDKFLSEVVGLETDLENMKVYEDRSHLINHQKVKNVNNMVSHIKKMKHIHSSYMQEVEQLDEFLGAQMKKSVSQIINQEITKLKTRLFRDLQSQDMMQMKQAFQSFILE